MKIQEIFDIILVLSVKLVNRNRRRSTRYHYEPQKRLDNTKIEVEGPVEMAVGDFLYFQSCNYLKKPQVVLEQRL